LPGVGENMQDHVETPSVIFTVEEPVSVQLDRIYTINNMLDFLLNGRG